MKRYGMVFLCVIIALSIGVITAVTYASKEEVIEEKVTNFIIKDPMNIIVSDRQDYSEGITIKAFQSLCQNKLGYIPKYDIREVDIVFYLWEHELWIPFINKNTDLLINVYIDDEIFKADNMKRIFKEKDSKNAYTKSLIEGDFYKIDFQKEGPGSVVLTCKSQFFGKTEVIKTKCREISEEFNEVYFTAEQYRQLEYDLYGMANK